MKLSTMKPSPSTMKYKISLVTNSEVERNKFLSLIKVINPHLNHYWETTGASEADFVIVDAEYDRGAFQKLKTDYPNGNIVFYTQVPPPDNVLYILKPVRASELINFLNNGGNSYPTQLTVIGDTEPNQVFIPEYLLSQIKQSKTSMLWTTKASPVIGYCHSDKTIVLNHKLFNSLFEKNAGDLIGFVRRNLEVSDRDVIELSKTNEFIVCDIGQFSWLTYLTLSNYVLHGDLTGNTAFGLYKWPDYTRLPHTPKDLVLTAALMKRPMTVHQLAGHTHIHRKRVIGFLNACHSVGQLRMIHTSPSPLESIQNRIGWAPSELVGKIMRKILGTV